MSVGRRLSALCDRPERLDKLQSLLEARVEREEIDRYKHVFREQEASAIFCTHQRSLEGIPAVIAARELDVPSTTFIFSWDNLTSKGRIAARFDHYLVWSRHMREELLTYYPSVPPENVHIVGSPQFDPYAWEDFVPSRSDFFEGLGLNPDRPLIVYSGGDTMTAPDDPAHLNVLLRLVRDRRVKGDPQVLVRPAPVDASGRFIQTKKEFPELVIAQPNWKRLGQDWSTAVPSLDDLRFLAGLTRHADVNVNLASTMTLDFALNDRPVVNVAFDVIDPPRFGKPLVEHYYRFEHYRPVVELGAARIARSPSELTDHLNAYLAQPSLDTDGRRRLVDLELDVKVGESTNAVWTALERLRIGP